MEIFEIFKTVLTDTICHSCDSPTYQEIKCIARKAIVNTYGESGTNVARFPGIGNIRIPFFSMGNVDSTNLFDLDELIIFAMYLKSKGVYKRCLDIGSNLGLHSIVMSKLGMKVTAYEPDPLHYGQLLDNLKINGSLDAVCPCPIAVSSNSGKAEFTRVLGNTTGSHLTGSKKGAYGALDFFEVNVSAINEILGDTDFIKLDAEGEERNILCSIPTEHWNRLDVIAEVGNTENAQCIYEYLSETGVNIFSQRKYWDQVKTPKDMPRSYRDGSIFITRKSSMPWF